MANHVRRQIREAVKTLLTGLPTTGSRVFTNRLQRIDDADLPCLMINTNSENITPQSVEYSTTLERHLTLSIKAVVKESDAMDDVLDEMIKEVESAVNASISSFTLDGLVKDMILQSINDNYEANGEQPVAEAVMLYEVSYYTVANAPDISI